MNRPSASSVFICVLSLISSVHDSLYLTEIQKKKLLKNEVNKILGENIKGECHDTGFVNDTNRYDIESIDKKLKIDNLVI